ncbi:MAG: GntR family transcriptional regulator [Pseudomonadota bacterium]
MKAARKAYEVIRSEIVEGRFAPGDRITEADIAEKAQVSRTPVREALRRLEAEGLIRFVPNQGAFVSSWGDDVVEETFELRALLEGYAARLCATRCSETQLTRLRQLAERQLHESEQRKQGYLNRITDLNEQFHQVILQAANSEQLRSMLSLLSNAPLVFQTFRDYSEADLIRSAHHHLELVEAFEAGDSEWAASVMRSHLVAARWVFHNVHGRNSGTVPLAVVSKQDQKNAS